MAAIYPVIYSFTHNNSLGCVISLHKVVCMYTKAVNFKPAGKFR